MEKLTILAQINKPIDQVWEAYNDPKDIVNWNFAHVSLTCPSAENDMKIGGRFKHRMEAKDGSFGFDLNGQKLMLLNAKPMFGPNHSISMMVMCETCEEVENYYNKLSSGGKVLMELNSYLWSEKYAWIKDKFPLAEQ
ncbi:VOC family protein [Soonwooa sp.]|uniref:VOC family protein n=1 Tax=Soonwooa sp. TaxID=1938592 RepID=UPI0028AA27CB|nr:VOC family protein [Soonwooa sp.]